jgi:hypothetical protein
MSIDDQFIQDALDDLHRPDEVFAREIRVATRMAKRSWNRQADQFNQWDGLGGDEQDELIKQELRK